MWEFRIVDIYNISPEAICFVVVVSLDSVDVEKQEVILPTDRLLTFPADKRVEYIKTQLSNYCKRSIAKSDFKSTFASMLNVKYELAAVTYPTSDIA